jgi:hypothetical protein
MAILCNGRLWFGGWLGIHGHEKEKKGSRQPLWPNDINASTYFYSNYFVFLVLARGSFYIIYVLYSSITSYYLNLSFQLPWNQPTNTLALPFRLPNKLYGSVSWWAQ